MEDIFAKKELVYTVYQERSFSKAAQKLFIAQPSLSLIVKKLEERIGCPLFDRTTKPIGLTEAGREYITAVEAIRQTETGFLNYLDSVNALQAGTLAIGSNQLLSSLVLPGYITKFAREYPGIKLSLVDANSTTLQNLITSGQLDIVIDNRILPQELFEKRLLTTEHLVLAVPAAFPENQAVSRYAMTREEILAGRHIQGCSVPLSAFSGVPFILMNRDNDTRKQTDAIFHTSGFHPQVLFEMDRLTTLYAYIQTGAAASIVSDTLIRGIGEDGRDIRFYPLSGPHTQRDIYVSYKRNRYYSRAMSAFIDTLGDLNRAGQQ